MKNTELSFEEIKKFKNIGELKIRVNDIVNCNKNNFLQEQADNNLSKILGVRR